MATAAERQAEHRRRQKQAMDALKAENAALRAELERLRPVTSPSPHSDVTMEQRLKEMEQEIRSLDRRLDHIEAMANQSY